MIKETGCLTFNVENEPKKLQQKVHFSPLSAYQLYFHNSVASMIVLTVHQKRKSLLRQTFWENSFISVSVYLFLTLFTFALLQVGVSAIKNNNVGYKSEMIVLSSFKNDNIGYNSEMFVSSSLSPIILPSCIGRKCHFQSISGS